MSIRREIPLEVRCQACGCDAAALVRTFTRSVSRFSCANGRSEDDVLWSHFKALVLIFPEDRGVVLKQTWREIPASLRQ